LNFAHIPLNIFENEFRLRAFEDRMTLPAANNVRGRFRTPQPSVP